jgi:uncharacterized protein (TIGR00369 family)
MNEPIDIDRLWRGWRRSPLHQFLEMDLEGHDRTRGEVRFRVPFKADYKRTPATEGIHGGVIASIIDIAAAFALAVAANKMGFPTIDLRIDYLRMAPDGDLSVVARSIKAGRTIGVADVEVRDTRGRLCAVGRGTYATAAG